MPKIFELAKDLEMRPLELVEKLKGLGLNVRSHMSVLSDEEAQKALQSLREQKIQQEMEEAQQSQSKKKKAKKKTTKKTTKKVAKKKIVTSKKVVKRKANEKADITSDDEKLKTEPSETQASSGGRKVLRKKASKIAEEKAQKAKQREEETRQKESEQASSTEQNAEGPVKKGLQVVFDPTLGGEDQRSKSQEVEQSLASPISGPPNEIKGDKFSRGPGGQEKEDQSKRRMGALSQMMARGKGVRRDLTQLRADEEMKSYGVIIGKVSYTPVGRKNVHLGPAEKTQLTEAREEKRFVNVDASIKGAELARKLKVKFKDFAGKALEFNLLLKSNDDLGVILAQELATPYNYRIRDISFKEDALIESDEKKEGDQESVAEKIQGPRAPVVTIMGHVDHGKTTLLDAIRKSKVVDSEAGGITQHVGAYQVDVDGQELTFLDTPGHAAFAAMRQRGADITDIVILVVAANDGVMPQTRESIGHCQQAGVPIIVAVNKMDMEGANPQRVQQELSEFELVPEEWGGQTQYVNISALKGEGLEELLEKVKLQAEMEELTGDSTGRAQGVVIESRVATGRGPMTTVLIQKGTLHQGDYLVAGETYGRGRSLLDNQGGPIKFTGPGTPVQILGLQDAPAPGDAINVVKNEREAKKIVDNRIEERRQLASVKARPKLSLEDFFAQGGSSVDEEKKILNLLVRADVQGSFEAIKNSLEGLGNQEVAVEVIGGGVGAVIDNDVMMAGSSGAHIIGFNMRPVTSARKLAEQQGVEIRTYSIIYQLIDDIRAALEGLLDPEKVETYIGRAQVKETFVIPKKGTIAGSSVIDGKIKKDCHIRLLREGKIVFDGKLSSLRRFKEDVKEVVGGLECGIALEGFNDIKRDDVFEAYFLEERKRKLQIAEEVRGRA